MKATQATALVAAALLADPNSRHWGYRLWKNTTVRTAVLYPILDRMLKEGILDDGWEDLSEIEEKRPPRRYYTVTDKGRSELSSLLARARAKDSRAVTPIAVLP